MTTRIVHISDLHFPARHEDQPAILAGAVQTAGPDIVVVSGDLSRSGTDVEFSQARDFIDRLPGSKLVIPGNHDVPMSWERISRPFLRFDSYFAKFSAPLETADVFIQGFNTAAGIQPRFDWSLGRIKEAEIDRIIEVFRAHGNTRLRIAVCHHPLRSHAQDRRRSRTKGGPEALEKLAASGVGLVLHGHLHRESCVCVDNGTRRICEVCANTALSDRERAGTSGFNIIDVAVRDWELTKFLFVDGHYRPRPPEPVVAELR